MSCVTYRLICDACGYDRFLFKKTEKKCPSCESADVIFLPEFDEQDDHAGSMKSCDDGTIRWCK